MQFPFISFQMRDAKPNAQDSEFGHPHDTGALLAGAYSGLRGAGHHWASLVRQEALP